MDPVGDGLILEGYGYFLDCYGLGAAQAFEKSQKIRFLLLREGKG